MTLFSQTDGAGETDKSLLRINELKSKLAALESDSESEDGANNEPIRLLKQAITDVEAAAEYSAKTEEYRQLVQTAPVEIQKISAELEKLESEKESSVKLDLDENASVETISAKLAEEEKRLWEITEHLKFLDKNLSDNDAEWATSGNRLIALRELIEAAENDSSALAAAADTPLKEAQMLAATAGVDARRSEQSMIEQKRLTAEPRLNLVNAKREKAVLEQEVIKRNIAKLQALTIQNSKDRVGAMRAELLEEKFAIFTKNAAIADLLNIIQSVSEDTAATFRKISEIDSAMSDARSELTWITRESDSLKSQIEVAGLEETSARLAMELQKELPARGRFSLAAPRRKSMMAEARLSAFQTNRDLRNQVPVQKERVALLKLIPDEAKAEPEYENFEKSVTNAIELHRQLQTDNAKTNRRLVDRINDLNLVREEAIALSERVRLYLGDKLLWEPNYNSLSLDVVKSTLPALISCFNAKTLGGIGTALWDHLVLIILTIGLVGLLVFGLPKKLDQFSEHSATLARRPSKDRILNTIKSSLAVLLKVSPFPFLLIITGWILMQSGALNIEIVSIGAGMIAVGIRLALFLVALGLCASNGVFDVHFGWSPSLLKQVHKTIRNIAIVYLPASFVLYLSGHAHEMELFGTLGRFALIIAMAAVLVNVWKTLFSKDAGILKGLNVRNSWWMRLRWVWISILIGLLTAIIFLCITGRLLAALTFAFQLETVVFFVTCGLFAYGLLTRWIFLKERRLQVKAAREAMLKKAEEENSPVQDDGELIEIEESSDLDFDIIRLQTRKLVNALCSMAVIFAIWFTWTEVIPLVKILDTRYIVGEFSIGDGLSLLLLTVVTFVLLRNLPGLFEVTLFGAVNLDAGARNAIITLSQYALIGTAAMVIFNKIGMDWSQFGWIAAALSVGLGFGLQEVVANFVSGLILLFERPIRIGDIVTVAGVDGVVSRIQIRATTITNWDRKEFVVPNKEFITGTLMNWTLSTPLTRIVVPVGVAYGSDTDRAREILINIARSHPKVANEPAPDAIFESFGDSTLDFTLRCFLDDPGDRLGVTHHLNTEVHRQFGEAGIEIAFPQRDLNIRSIEFPQSGKISPDPETSHSK